MNNREETLRKIDAGLTEMQRNGHQDTIHYQNLQGKREAVAKGLPYRSTEMAPALIAGFGAMIPSINYVRKEGKTMRILKDNTHFFEKIERQAQIFMEELQAVPCQPVQLELWNDWAKGTEG